MTDANDKREFVRENYAKIAQGKSPQACCSNGCSCGSTPLDSTEANIRMGYSTEELLNAPAESTMGLGCGNPLSIAELKEGETVLDLGSGGGIDCFLASRKVGAQGQVIGVDMTPDMISLSRKNAIKHQIPNVEFRLGEIEHLPVADNTIDVIISNCVLNLSFDKEQVFQEAYRVLKPGGRIAISDILATKALPNEIKEDLTMISSCIGGAELLENVSNMLSKSGFRNIQLIPKDNSKEIVKTWAPERNIEDFIASYYIKAER
jgi:arsenite methyltransferase